MKKLGIFLFILGLLSTSILKAYSPEPKSFVNELVNEAINILSDKNLNIDDKKKFIEKIALENVDIPALGLYTLGELRKSSKESDLVKYQKALRNIF